MQAWQTVGIDTHEIDLAQIRRLREPISRITTSVETRSVSAPRAPAKNRQGIERRIMSMVFTDATGFSKIKENSAPNYLEYFLGEVRRLIDSAEAEPAFVNTWGDGLYVVFSSVVDTGRFCLELRDMVNDKVWGMLGLPENNNVRIALLTGPVFSRVDPVINITNFFGMHVNTAARIEPSVVPGAVYVIEQAASCIRAAGREDIYCEMLCTVPLAKEFGDQSLYVVQWAKGHDSRLVA